MNPLPAYLAELQAVRASGARVKETSYYPAVSGLFNAVGKTLKPTVRCIINLKNTGWCFCSWAVTKSSKSG